MTTIILFKKQFAKEEFGERKMKHILFVAATLALLLSACGPQAKPTADPLQLQASVVAAANTMVALTMAAIPTATPVPPTPVPSPTLEASPTPIQPTLSAPASPTGAASSNGKSDPCLGPLISNGGPDIKNVKISNENNEPIILSLHLDKNSFAECGFRGFNIGPNQSIDVTNLKAGCYFAAAIVGNKSKAFGSTCFMDYTHGWAIKVMAEQITFVGP